MHYTQNQPAFKNLTTVKKSILATLAYFDLFSYPLTAAEVYLFLGEKSNQAEVNEGLHALIQEGSIFNFSRFYTLQNDYSLIVRRYNGNVRAADMIKIADRISNLLIKFPYVRGIAISGSLSKNFADEYSDIDLFIITAKNRLWIARTLMHILKKFSYLANRQDYFCMNYYIDKEALQITEHNVYTAIEVVTLMPLQGDSAFENFYAANQWTHKYLPNKLLRVSSARPLKDHFWKKTVEMLLNNRIGCWLDRLLMKITARRWRKKTDAMQTNAKGFIMAMDVNRHYSKPDPKDFQQQILKRYQSKVSAVLHTHEDSMFN
jgi:predicted nucleotidyltransferase